MAMERDVIEENSVFENSWWLDVVAPGRWHEIICVGKKGEYLGRMFYVDSSLYGIPYVGMPSMTQQMGPQILLSDKMKPVKKRQRIKKVLEEMLSELDKHKNVDIAFHSSLQYFLPFVWHGYQVIPAVSYVLEDLTDLECVYNGMEAKLRNLIKNAQKQYTVEETVSSEELVSLQEKTFAKQGRGLPKDVDFYRRIYKTAMEHQAGRAIGAREKETGKLVAAAFFLYDANTCYYLMGGKDYTQKTSGSQELLLWEGIQFAAKVSKEFDFEGSMIPGVESFFLGFGGRPRVYFRVRKGGGAFQFLHWVKPYVKRILGYK